MDNERQRLQELAGINEIKVNKPIKIKSILTSNEDDWYTTYDVKISNIDETLKFTGNKGWDKISLEFPIEDNEEELNKFNYIKDQLSSSRIPFTYEDDGIFAWIFIKLEDANVQNINEIKVNKPISNFNKWKEEIIDHMKETWDNPFHHIDNLKSFKDPIDAVEYLINISYLEDNDLDRDFNLHWIEHGSDEGFDEDNYI